MWNVFFVLVGLAWSLGPASAQDGRIRLIVRGDDFGYTHASNEAMEQAFAEGIMQSASVLAPGPWFTETAAILKAHPEWSAGVHLTITAEWNRLRWGPVSPETPLSLLAPDGGFWGFGYDRPKPDDWPADGAPWAEGSLDPGEVEREFRAQIKRAREMGVRLDYIDCHMGMACREGLLAITRKLAGEYCLGISSAGLYGEERFSPDYPEDNDPAGIEAALIAAIESLEPGLYLYVGHPAADSPELRAVDSNSGERWARRRSSVLAAWTSDEVQAAIERKGVELVSMRKLNEEAGGCPVK